MPDFPEAISKAHANHLRPRCLCQPGASGIEMYVARLSDCYVIKRMPNTGWHHATDCTSYELPADFSGLGPLVGSAIVENPVTGITELRLNFPMTKLPGRHVQPAACSASSSVTSNGQKLGLRALLHYLWDQAELTHWKPGFAGRRHWATVRRLLLQAAENKVTRGQQLLDRLFVPEVFAFEQREAIQARRLQQWLHASATSGRLQPLLLLIGEVKELVPCRYGYMVIIKHVPDQYFAIDEKFYRKICRAFESELALWNMDLDAHMLMLATFRVMNTGTPCIEELTLMPTTRQWIPFENIFEKQLLDALINNQRAFTKGLRFNLQNPENIASVVLLDTKRPPECLWIDTKMHPPAEGNAGSALDRSGAASRPWAWRPAEGEMPPLPRSAKTHIAKQTNLPMNTPSEPASGKCQGTAEEHRGGNQSLAA